MLLCGTFIQLQNVERIICSLSYNLFYTLICCVLAICLHPGCVAMLQGTSEASLCVSLPCARVHVYTRIQSMLCDAFYMCDITNLTSLLVRACWVDCKSVSLLSCQYTLAENWASVCLEQYWLSTSWFNLVTDFWFLDLSRHLFFWPFQLWPWYSVVALCVKKSDKNSLAKNRNFRCCECVEVVMWYEWWRYAFISDVVLEA